MSDDKIDKQLRDVQKILSEPGKKILGKLVYILNFLNPLGRNYKNGEEEKKSNVLEIKQNNITWIDIENPKREDINELSEKYPFHPLHLEASLLKGELDRVDKENDYLFIILHTPSYDEKEDRVLTNQISIFLGKNYLVTVHDDSLSRISNLLKECRTDKDKRDALFKNSASFLLYNVIEDLIRDISVLHQTVFQELDKIEDLVFDVKISGAYRVSQLRQKILRLKRVLGSFKNKMQELSGDKNFIGSMNRYYENIANELNKLWESLDEARETIEIYKDADFTMSTDKTNKVLAVLTILFTLTIPATVFGTFYGMNILLPGGLEAGHWTFFGTFTTFYVIIAISAIPAIFMIFYFKSRDWF